MEFSKFNHLHKKKFTVRKKNQAGKMFRIKQNENQSKLRKFRNSCFALLAAAAAVAATVAAFRADSAAPAGPGRAGSLLVRKNICRIQKM